MASLISSLRDFEMQHMTKEDIASQLDKRIHGLGSNALTTWSKYRGKDSDWSRQILCSNNDACSTIKDTFSLDVKNWENKFKEAPHGQGNEIDRILTLHSSALLALLCFSHVSTDNPLLINGVAYEQCWFEVQNRVYDRPSSIDIVLKANDGTLLFLESKFTEYLHSDSPNIAYKYFDFYKVILPLLPGCPLQMVFPKTWTENGVNILGLGLIPKSKADRYTDLYLGGIKQCFSHLIGLAKGPQNEDEECWLDIAGRKIYFGSIVYELNDSHFSIYRDFYSETIGRLTSSMLADSVPDHGSHVNQIHILPNILTYQEIFGNREFKLSVKVRKFYEL